jgi:hypothetical protein
MGLLFFGTKIRFKRQFVITTIVITEFDCNRWETGDDKNYVTSIMNDP